MHLLFYPNIKKTETKSMLNRNLSLENFKTPGGHWEGQSHSLAVDKENIDKIWQGFVRMDTEYIGDVLTSSINNLVLKLSSWVP